MKIKQIKTLFLAFFFVVSSAVGIVSLGAGGGTANAYVCNEPGNPNSAQDWEYHETSSNGIPAGSCWKVRYTSSGKAEGYDTDSPKCPTGQILHTDDNTCWYRNGYTIQETGTITPTLNNGDPIPSNNAACNDGFTYRANGRDGPGCYKQDTSGEWCRRGVGIHTINTKDNVQGCDSQTPNTDPNAHVIPKDPRQSTDTTKPKTDGTPKTDCTGHGTLDTATGLCTDGTKPVAGGTAGEKGNEDGSLTNCGEAQTVLITCDKDGRGASVIGAVLKFAIAALTVLIGIAAVGGIVWEALQYARAQDDQSIVSNAKNRIRDIIIGLVVYIFMIAFVNWLVPGGIIPG
jgi:hypothetical protein